MRKLIEERTRGHRVISGTEWPILDRLEMESRGAGMPTWIITIGLCNGVPESASEHRKLTDALSAWRAT